MLSLCIFEYENGSEPAGPVKRDICVVEKLGIRTGQVDDDRVAGQVDPWENK
jgi:hypothetical protein